MPQVNKNATDNYDLEPVTYCPRCYSLKIKYEEEIDADCCMECGCSDTKTTTIGEWEKLYEGRYGRKYVVKSNDPRKSIIFNLPMDKLKARVFNSPQWLSIIKTLYPHFPNGLSKADSVILLFDKLVKDGKLDDLRYTLLKYYKN